MKKQEFIKAFITPLIIRVEEGVIHSVYSDESYSTNILVKYACNKSRAVKYGKYSTEAYDTILTTLKENEIGDFCEIAATEETMKKLKQGLQTLAKVIYAELVFPAVVADGDYNVVSTEIEEVNIDNDVLQKEFVASLDTRSYDEALVMSRPHREEGKHYVIVYNNEEQEYELYVVYQ